MNVLEYFWILVKMLFVAAGDNERIKGALLLLLLCGFALGFVAGLVVSALAARKKTRD